MDKYEYNLKLEEIDKLVDQGDYDEAANLADTIDWRRVRNVRTLCLISEIYEASGRLEDSKNLLVRAYKRSPVGRNVLYRLAEVTTALGQYDEAIEYYTEYVQAAPHDNNRYILKYNIYKGRGSSLDELIEILEEYLGQEYTERWAYELATLYQKAGHMQKCLAACDDLVLWFHSGKYVQKALELKRKYAALTPKQQQIYEECMQTAEETAVYDDTPEEEDNIIQKVESTDGEVIAESIMAETEKEIAGQVSARKAELEQAALLEQEQQAALSGEAGIMAGDTAVIPDIPKETPAAEAVQEHEEEEQEEKTQNLQVELAKSMREIIAGVVKRNEENEDDLPASMDTRLNMVQKLTMPKVKEPAVSQLSIDDILLSMGEKGKQIAAEAQAREAAQAEEEARRAAEEEERRREAELAAQKAKEEAVEKAAAEKEAAAKASLGKEKLSGDASERKEAVAKRRQENVKSIVEAAADELTEAQREALQYTNNPEKLLRNKNALPTYAEEPQEDLGKTRRIASKEELMEAARQEILSEKTIRIPTEEVARALREGASAQDGLLNAEGQAAEEEDTYRELTDGEETAYGAQEESYDGEAYEEEPFDDEEAYDDEEPYDEEEPFDEEEYEEEYDEDQEYLTLPNHLRSLFSGFTEIEGLEDQIANAIIQAESKGDDRTSRSGNILIFGSHGSGKTTMAMNIARAIAQDKGSQVMKMAKIYAADLNRKDIAATIAKIAGGTLIVEEAGDLEPATVEQLTTAMEFRTDGLIVILEDEQQYIHELLMRHPRFTMKFTAQIYIPEYTVEELAMFGQLHANAQDYVIGEEGMEVFQQKIADVLDSGNPVTITDVIQMVSSAIAHSNKFFRKLSMGKKRYNESDYIILFAKDFK